MKLTITDPGSLLPVILEVEITPEQADLIYELVTEPNLELPEPMSLDQVADVLAKRVAFERRYHDK